MCASSLSNFVTKVVQTSGPAVVKVMTERDQLDNADDLNDLLLDIFVGADGIYFGDGTLTRGERGHGRRRINRGQGSGFLIDQSIVLTNAHVVQGVDRVTILTTTGAALAGTVRGVDNVLDVAAIAINAPMRLPTIALSDCSRMQVGQWAIAIGNPLGLSNSVSLGVVSSLNPTQEVALDWASFEYLQTDVRVAGASHA